MHILCNPYYNLMLNTFLDFSLLSNATRISECVLSVGDGINSSIPKKLSPRDYPSNSSLVPGKREQFKFIFLAKAAFIAELFAIRILQRYFGIDSLSLPIFCR